MKKRFLFVGGIAVVIVAVITAIIIYTQQSKDTNGITRYEWVQMLTEQFMIKEYSNETPYYKDITSENQYFAAVQAAYEWEILDDTSSFHGEEIADGEFVALTAMRAVGRYKIQIYLEMTDEPNESEYLELALKEKLIDKEQLKGGITLEEAEVVLEKAKQFYMSTFWRDDYVKIQYKDGVKELEGKSILEVSPDSSEITVLHQIADTLASDDIIVFINPITGEKQAKKIKSINNEGIVALEDISLDKVINSLTISDITSVAADDIFSHISEGKAKPVINTSLSQQYSAIPVWDKKVSGHSDGLSISVEASDEEIVVKYVNNDTGLGCEIPIEETLPEGSEINATVDVSRIDAGVEVYYDLGGLEYANAQIESDITCVGEINVSAEKRIPIGEIPIVLAGGVAAIDLQLFLKFSIDGTISLQADIPVQFAVGYTKDAGVRTFADVQINPEIMADCSAECSLNFAPGIAVLGYDVFSIETGIGVAVDAEIMSRVNSDIVFCAELSVAAPIINVAVVFNDDISEIIDNTSEILDVEIPLEWELMSKENAWFQKALHYEWYSDGTFLQIEKCTYGNEKQGKVVLFDEPPHNYFMYFTSEFVDKGDYYEVTGKVFDHAHIPIEKANDMVVGDSYTYDNVTFTVIERIVCEYCASKVEDDLMPFPMHEKGDTFLILKDDKDNLFLVDPHSHSSWTPVGGKTTEYYEIEYAAKEEFGYKNSYFDGIGYYPVINGDTLLVVDDDYTFYIPKERETEVQISESKMQTYTVGEVVENNIENYEGLLFSSPEDMLISLIIWEDSSWGEGMGNSYWPMGELQMELGKIAYRDLDGTMHALIEEKP